MFPWGFSVRGFGGLGAWACGLERRDKGRGRLLERMYVLMYKTKRVGEMDVLVRVCIDGI